MPVPPSSSDSGGFVVEYTNKEIFEAISENQKISEEILSEAKTTNGRLSRVESKSLGIWISNHPIKFVVIALVIVLGLIAESRHFTIDAVKSIVTGLL